MNYSGSEFQFSPANLVGKPLEKLSANPVCKPPPTCCLKTEHLDPPVTKNDTDGVYRTVGGNNCRFI